MIDLDAPSSWPAPVRHWVQQNAGADSVWLAESEQDFRDLLAGISLAFHSTCLLPHELWWIRRDGLQLLSRELVERRIRAAHEHGFISAAHRGQLLASHAYAADESGGRHPQICVSVGRDALRDPGGCDSLLTTWGGEAIYRYAPQVEDRLRGIGTPTIVVVAIDLSAGRDLMYTAPQLGRLFIDAANRGLSDRFVFADVHLYRALPSSRILDVWQQGHPEYDHHLRRIR